ncbi:meiotic nuclear division protein 1 homolog isoform X1 [Amborella trichopoda]|uniref:meiotic nuclear division protein 1 homolog isoform X1 n=1 Tax=Amborella trichopoda TaxID=13333 RepID=UPI0009BF7F60|nr:meiotic nuclear division protein 1 homolog isoform X1 [Amborella trichopoda]|eukprot:XP_020528626.1 meiotic nuclear division protein 1 homolog isoform X1 [Amborella trichopoda]
MSKKRGLSLEEKREQILQIFYESQDFFLLRELEKLGPRKGVVSQTVKDVVQSLVDDDLVSKDKIGSSVYFWSLPSCAGNQLRNAYSKLESDIASSKKRFDELVQQRDSLKKGREESDEREAALVGLKAIEEQYNALKRMLPMWPMQLQIDGQTIFSPYNTGARAIFQKPKNNLSICTRRLESQILWIILSDFSAQFKKSWCSPKEVICKNN